MRHPGICLARLLLPIALATLFFCGKDIAVEDRGMLTESPSGMVSLAARRAHRYRVVLQKGDYLAVTLHQEGVDLTLTLVPHRGEPVFQIDGLTLHIGREAFWWIADKSGTYQVAVTAKDPKQQGAYRIETILRRPAGQADREVAAAFAVCEQARDTFATMTNAESVDRVLAPVRERCANHRAILADLLLAAAFDQWGRKEYDRAEPLFREALQIFLDLGQRVEAAITARNLARTLGDTARKDAADAAFQTAQDSARDTDPWLEGQILAEYGWFLIEEGRFQNALDCYQKALILAEKAGSRSLEATVIEEMGYWHMVTGRIQKARDLYMEAAAIWRELNRSDRLYLLNTEIGWTYFRDGRYSLAISQLREGITGQGTGVGKAHIAGRWDRLGTAYREAGRYGEAEQAYYKALALLPQYSPNRADVWCNLAETRLEIGDLAEATTLAEGALAGFEEAGEAMDRLHGSFILASIQREQGRIDSALASISQAVAVLDQLRDETSDHALGRSFIHTYADYLMLYLDLLIEAHGVQPDLNYHRTAWTFVDLVRARGLVGILTAKTPSLGAGPTDLATVRNELLDEDSVLLYYSFGPEKGYLWAISRSAFQLYILPGSSTALGQSLANFQNLVANPAQAEQMVLQARKLSDILLAPAADLIAGKQLLIVKDEILQGLPFGALPDPLDGEPLIAGHPLSFLPSVAYGVHLKRLQAHRQPADLDIAVFADPVYQADDARLSRPPGAVARGAASLIPSRRAIGPYRGDLARLKYTAWEAHALLAHTTPQRSLPAMDFDASLAYLRDADLARYRLLHFAAHGILNPATGEDSGIVLSLYDRDGNARDGFLYAGELAEMNLRAELVTLSACRSAIGEPFRGEGPWGLIQSSFAAGAARVLVSLWNVEDRATAWLMERFYDNLFRLRLAPPEALRQAQLTLWRESGAAPFYWAGFELHGDRTVFSLGN